MGDINFKSGSLVELSNNILSATKVMRLREGTKDLYLYNDKFYEPLSEFKLGQIIHKFYIDHNGSFFYTPTKGENLLKTIKTSPAVKEIDFDNYDNLINVNNGVLNLDTYEITKHSFKYNFTYCLDVDYDVDSVKSPNFNKFLEGIFTTAENKIDHDTIENIWRLGGYLIYPQSKVEKIFILLGGGENGKTMLIDIFASFFPDKFVTSISLNTLSNASSQERTPLITSRFNVSSEAKGEKIDDGEIKKIASGQKISIARKFLDPLDMKSRTKLFVDSNHSPYFNDTSWGMERRLCIFSLANTFLEKSEFDKVKNPDTKRVFLGKNKDEFMTAIMKEKSAILNLFINGLIDLRKLNWKIPQTQNMAEIMSDYKDKSDPVGTWLTDNYEANEKPKNKNDYIPILAIINEFGEYYSKNYPGKKFSYSTKLLGRRIRELFKVEGKQTRFDNSTTTGYPLTRKTVKDETACLF